YESGSKLLHSLSVLIINSFRPAILDLFFHLSREGLTSFLVCRSVPCTTKKKDFPFAVDYYLNHCAYPSACHIIQFGIDLNVSRSKCIVGEAHK
ncbi:TPA: hypothetical protein ACPFYT_004459, partial [Salmonella enterica subsp. enterica serovar Typhi]